MAKKRAESAVQDLPVAPRQRRNQLDKDRKLQRQEHLAASVAEIGLKVNGVDRCRSRQIEMQLSRYTNLIHTTARRIEHVVEESREDIEQLLWVKCHKALLSYDPTRVAMPRDAYVANCIIRRKIDILRADKGKKRKLLYIEDLHQSSGEYGDRRSHSSFELDFMSIDADAEYAYVERELPLIPSTLTPFERQVLVLLYDDLTPLQIQKELAVKGALVKEAISQIRLKFSDWSPGSVESAVAA